MTRLDLLERVTRFKNVFFKSSWSDYASAKPGSFRLVPPGARRAEVETDYGKMEDFFMVRPPTFEDLWERLRGVGTPHRNSLTESLVVMRSNLGSTG